MLDANQAIVAVAQLCHPAGRVEGARPARRSGSSTISARPASASRSPPRQSLRFDFAELEGMGFANVRFDATRFLRQPESFTDFHTADIAPYAKRFQIELCGTGVIDEQQLLSLFEDGIVLVQGPHIGGPGPVRADLVVERRPEAAAAPAPESPSDRKNDRR